MEVHEVFVVITLAVFNVCWGVMASLPVRRTLFFVEKPVGTKSVAGTSVPHGGIREGRYRLPNQSRWHQKKE